MASARALRGIIETYTKWRLKTSPEYATGVDVHDYNDALEEQSVDAYREKYNSCLDFTKELHNSVKVKDLMGDDLFLYKLIKNDLDVFTNGYKWRFHSTYNAVNFLETIPIDFMSFLIDTTRFEGVEDFKNYSKRLEHIPRQISQHMELMKEAIDNGTTSHKCTMERTLSHLEKQLVSTASKSVFFEPVEKKLPLLKNVTKEEHTYIHDLVAGSIEKKVCPSLEKLCDFISKTYMGKCRPEYGVGSLKDGDAYYQACLQWHTTSSLTPQEIHSIGLKEVGRISANMKDIMDQLGFEGSIAEFSRHLHQKSEFFHTDPQEMLREFTDIMDSHISPKLSLCFSDTPDVPCLVKEMPFEGPGGMYYPAAADGSRPGTFFVQLQHLNSFPKFTMMSLTLHEAIPGHHFQHISAHARKLPKFHCERDYRKLHSAPFQFPINTAYVEGWALYAEFLGEEMGVYRSPYEMFGRYCDEIFRASRLVVDTGLHVFGWSREKAVEYMQQYCAGLPDGEIQEEVDRYLTWPGQACAYKIGELKIKELRQRAESTLGDRFQLKEFHSVVLSLGPVSLGMLEEYVDQWINGKSESL